MHTGDSRHGWRRMSVLAQREECFDRQTGTANQRPQRACREFFVERNGEIGPDAFFDENEMTTYLSRNAPSRFLKCFRCFTAGDVAEGAHDSDGDDDPVSIREL